MERDEICRTCLKKITPTSATSIYNELHYDSQICKITTIIMACAPIEITDGDGLPTTICENCLKLLHISFMFRISILQADQKLRSQLVKVLVPSMQTASGGLVESFGGTALMNDNSLPMISLLQPVGNISDPLRGNLQGIDGSIKTEIPAEIQPIEQILLPESMTQYPTEEDEPLCNIPTETTNNQIIVQNKSDPPVVNLPITFNMNMYNPQVQADSNQIILTDSNLKAIQSSIQNASGPANEKFFLLKLNPTDNPSNLGNYRNIAPKEVEKNKVDYCSLNQITPKKVPFDDIKTNSSFEDELKKFVVQKQRLAYSTYEPASADSTKKRNSPQFFDESSGNMMQEVQDISVSNDSNENPAYIIPELINDRIVELTESPTETQNIYDYNRTPSENIGKFSKRARRKLEERNKRSKRAKRNTVYRVCINDDQTTSVIIDD